MASVIQKQILHKALQSPLFSKDVLTQAPQTIFEGDDGDNYIYKDLANIIKRYYQTDTNIMSEETLLTLTEDKLDRMGKSSDEQNKYFRIISELYQIPNNKDDVIDEKIEEYIRKHMRVELLQKAVTRLDDEEFMETLDKRWKDIMLMDISGKKQEVINVLDDTEYKRQALSTLNANIISTGFSSIDFLNNGGLAKGELGMIVASSGTGKTMLLTNLATNYTRMGYNVFFIALEELENRMILKFEQAMLKQNRSSILNGNTLNETRFDQLQNIYKKHRDKFGNLYFSRFSPRTITPDKIEQLVSDVMLRNGVDIDVVIIDYPDLLRNPQATGNESEDGGKLFEEMRRIGQDYNVVMWTASQMNRTAYSADLKTSEHMEGSHRKKNPSELVLTVNQTPEEFNGGYIRLYADKLRNPPEGSFDRMLGLKVLGSAMTVRDYANEQEEREHDYILETNDNKNERGYKSNNKNKEQQQQQPDFASQINNSLRGSVQQT